MASTEIISIDYGCDKISLCSDDDPVSFRITADLFIDSAIIANDSSSDTLPSDVIHNLKGLLGQKYSAVKDSLELPRCAEGTPTDSIILGAHLQKTPEGVLADLLQGSLKRVAKQSFLLQVVMTVPSYYTAEQRMATISALQLAGFRIKSVIHDTSAILAAVNTKYVAGNNESIVLALDLGHNGGSACIARLRSDTAIVLAHSTERIPGGRDFDNKMLCYLKQLVQDTYKSAVQHSCDQKLMEAWRILKCDLSQKLTSTLRLPVDTVNGSIQVDIDISREAFEKECKPLFEKIVSIVMLTIKKSGIDSCDIHRIFLVGGSSNIPCVRSMLSKSLGKNTDDPAVDELVAYGARLIGTGKFQVIRDIRTSSSWDRNAVIEAVLTVTCNAIPSAQQLAQVKTVDGFWWQVASIMKGPTAYKETVRKAALSLYKEVYQRHCKETFVEVIQNAIIDRGLKCSSTVPNETANLQAEGDATGATLENNRCGVTEVPHNSGAQEPELEPGEDSDGGTSEFMQVPPGLVNRKTFSITRQSWESIKNGADKTKLVSYEWGTVINSWIEAEYNQFCVLKCRYHHVSPIDSRKKNVPLLHATAQCKFNNCGCLSFDITIAKPETTTEDLQVTVTSSGNFCHRVGEKHRRHIRQNERSQFKAKLDVMAPSVLTRRAVATKSKETNALTYGNYNHCPSSHTSRKMASEKNAEKYLHGDQWTDLVITSETLNEKNDFEIVHYYSLKDFNVMWETRDQLSYLNNIKTDGLVILHIDATGSVVGCLPWSDNVVYLYVIAVKGKDGKAPIPVAQFLTDRHKATSISFWLARWMDRRSDLVSKPRRIDVVVCDFSWAIIHAIVRAMCGMDIVPYLQKCFESTKKPFKHTIVAICKSHVMKAVSNQVYKLRPSKSQEARMARGLALYAFAFLMGTSDLETASKVVTLMAKVFCSKYEDNVLSDSVDALTELLKDEEIEELEDEEIRSGAFRFRDDDEEETKRKDTLYSQSPFYDLFNDVVRKSLSANNPDSDSDCGESNDKENPFYIKGFVDTYLLKRYLPYYPVVSAFLLKQRDPKQELLCNWPVENSFNDAKNRSLSKKNQRPGVVVQELTKASDEIMSVVKYDPDFKKQTKSRKRKADEDDAPTNEPERWSKRRKTSKKSYADKARLNKYLKNLRKQRDAKITAQNPDNTKSKREKRETTPMPNPPVSFSGETQTEEKESELTDQQQNQASVGTPASVDGSQLFHKKRRSIGTPPKKVICDKPWTEARRKVSVTIEGSTATVLNGTGYLHVQELEALLNRTGWLGDGVIDAFISTRSALAEKEFGVKVFPAGCYVLQALEEGREEIIPVFQNAQLMDYDILMFPYNCRARPEGVRDHWSLIVVIFKLKYILYIDSMTRGTYVNDQVIKLLQGMISKLWDSERLPLFWEDWRLFRPKRQIVDQGNCYDCGVHVCLWAHVICCSQKLNIRPTQCAKARQWIHDEIILGPPQVTTSLHRKFPKERVVPYEDYPLEPYIDWLPDNHQSFVDFCATLAKSLFKANFTTCAAAKCISSEGEMYYCRGHCMDWYHLPCIKETRAGAFKEKHYFCPPCRVLFFSPEHL